MKQHCVMFQNTMPSIKVSPIADVAEQYQFSVTLNNRNKITTNFKYSIANAAKPLIYFTSLFGMRMVRFAKNNILEVKIYSKVYTIVYVSVLVMLINCMRPASWRDTTSDLPLNILTKTYGCLSISEAIYGTFIAAFGNSHSYVKLFRKLDQINSHFGSSTSMVTKIRVVSVFFITIPILLLSGTFWLRKFNIVNIGLHIAYFMLVLGGTVVTFILILIYTKQLMLNTLLVKKISKCLPPQKELIFADSKYNIILKKIFTDSKMMERKANGHYCWFELMQIYDQIADCIFYFNKIYAGQVFIMFNTWFLCTLLTICRSLSPSMKYSEVFLNDLFMYSSINSRPIFLAKMCELFIKERNKTVSMLLHNLVYGVDEAYSEQVQTMLDLVKARKIEVSAKVFTADVATVIEFAGRSISYTVLMIQYFYLRVFSTNN